MKLTDFFLTEAPFFLIELFRGFVVLSFCGETDLFGAGTVRFGAKSSAWLSARNTRDSIKWGFRVFFEGTEGRELAIWVIQLSGISWSLRWESLGISTMANSLGNSSFSICSGSGRPRLSG